MKNWEFLLQREGDTTWLPLETPDVEILEGRYRVVARSGYPNAKISVRITHHALEETPPVRRVQTRTTNTSAEGLLIVIPYTRLKPGIWDLSCDPQLQPTLVSKSSDNSVKLRVLSNDSEPLEQPPHIDESLSSDSEFETPDLSESSEEMTQTTSSDKPLVEVIDQRNTSEETQPPSPQQELTATPQTELSSDDSEQAEALDVSPVSIVDIESLNGDDQPAVTPQSPSHSGIVEVQLTLEKESYVAKLGQALLISGRVEDAESFEPSNSQPLEQSIDQPCLHVYLRDPHNSNILLHVQQPIPLSIIPIPFSCLVYLPFECKTRLILGEIMISSNGVPVTSHLFTIATQVEHLLDAIGTDVSPEEQIEIITDESDPVEPTTRLHLIDPNALPEPEPISEPYSRRPTVPVIQANPQTNQPLTTASSLELPSFGDFRSENANPPVEVTTSSKKTTSASSELADGEILTPTEEPLMATSAFEDDSDSNEESQFVQVSPVDPAFQSLNLENRFWSRLNALAQDRDLSQWMKQAKPTPMPETSFMQTRAESPETAVASPSVQADPLFVPLEDDLESQEIVVDDEAVDASPLSYSRERTLRLVDSYPTQASTSETSAIVSEDEPIAPPILEIINPEIIAGRTVKVRVRMNENLPRIYVKIWVYDRQSRTIVDGPRWLTEFSPNGFNQIETTVNLEIAYGSLEVQFEAIAVEMQTQRESHKVIVERSVIPPAAPTLPLEEK
ncbi:hypothetical protein VB834_04460 [Limnoraphis robusta Tam1]|uniref:hypothetical protein n=1 Tax=Limnoraphis robusta TaxID=1118279 RepID=UPI002B21E8D7|nr:hypothetical protein [Limnoraphis robusta]MEA5538281.1 hypothetical protein [Limnoraphis robusta Tam1]